MTVLQSISGIESFETWPWTEKTNPNKVKIKLDMKTNLRKLCRYNLLWNIVLKREKRSVKL